MKTRIIVLFLVASFLTACVSIPRQTVTLSQTIGSDLRELQRAHLNFINIYFDKIRTDINVFIDDVYAPYVIHYILKIELKNFKDGIPSIYGTIQIAGQKEGKDEAENALNEMIDFVAAARLQIENKRIELLSPIIIQESEIVNSVNQSYENVIYANSTITAHLQSIRKVKDAQEEALAMIGLRGADTLTTNTLVKLSEQIDIAIKKGKEIDLKSDDASKQLETIIGKLKELTIKK